MYTNTLAAAFVAALPALASAGSAIVNNYCDQNVYLWSIDNENYSPPMHTIAPGEAYSEPYRTPATGGVSIKMATGTDLYQISPPLDISQFEYTLNDKIWYDISNINGNPFQDGGLSLSASDPSCPAKFCPAGVTLCGDAYNKPNDDHATAACSAGSDTTFDLCPSRKGANNAAAAPAKAAPAKAAPAVEHVAEPEAPAPTPAAAAPATTPAPEVEAEVITAIGHPDWVWTTFVTQVVTIYERDAAPIADPTAAPEAVEKKNKRAAHRHHAHRHGADAE